MPETKTLQRDKNVTVWIPRKFHKKLKMMSWKRGVSITFILNEILCEYFETIRKIKERIKEGK